MLNTTLFYVFIGISLFLVWGYFYGKRKNNRIAKDAIDSLIELTKPDRKSITNIGGLVGYHVNLDFEKSSIFEKIEATITLLPRQSLLYYPFSVLVRKSDRFFITFYLKNSVFTGQYLMNKDFMEKHRQEIAQSNQIKIKTFNWEGEEYCYCYQDDGGLEELKDLKKSIKKPDELKEIAIHPGGNIIEILVVPQVNKNEQILALILEWIRAYS